jgi:hypothetical protein
MLDELHLRDLGVIEDVTLRLAPGLNVLTGETGAGKTIIVSALELLRGARASAPQVRQGADVAVAEARLHPVPDTAADWTNSDDDDLVIAREVAVSEGGGRSRARVGGHLAPVSALREVTDGLIEMHGQQDSTRLTTATASTASADSPPQLRCRPTARRTTRGCRPDATWRHSRPPTASACESRTGCVTSSRRSTPSTPLPTRRPSSTHSCVAWSMPRG